MTKNHYGRRLRSETIEDRFWKKTDVRGVDDCWPWMAGRQRAGYGSLTDRITAHRFSYELHNGPILVGMRVCHHCDNPPCVNPNHLFLGTPADNTADMVRKGRARGRGSPGESNPASKLTEVDAIRIRTLFAWGEQKSRIARQFSIGETSVTRVVRGDTWKTVSGWIPEEHAC